MLDDNSKRWLLALDASRRAPTQIKHRYGIYLLWAVMLTLISYHWVMR